MSETSGAATATPVPSSAVASTLEFEATVNDAVRSAATVGLNVTLIVQLAPAASVATQVLVAFEKSAELVPPMVMLLIFNTRDALVFFSVTNCAALVVLMV